MKCGVFVVAALILGLGIRAEAATVLYTLPESIYFAEESGKPVPTDRAIVMYGGDVRKLYVDVKDVGNDGSVANDYVEYSTTTSGDNTLSVIQGSVIGGAANTINYIPGALNLSFNDPGKRTRRLGAVSIEATQPPSGSVG